MTKTKIEWADRVWNPVTGCSKVSEGCRQCYAERHAKRFWGERKFTDVQCHEERLDQPLGWRKPARVFVNSMSDLFHEDVPVHFIVEVFQAMNRCRKHTYIILTKRPERMQEFVSSWKVGKDFIWAPPEFCKNAISSNEWPLPNVWLGVSVENQATADERIPLLLQTPAAKRIISYEPALGPVDFGSYLYPAQCILCDGDPFYKRCADGQWRCPYCGDGSAKEVPLDWIIMGGESGPNARPMHPDLARSVRDQCQDAGVPFFFKQWGEYHPAPSQLRSELHWINKAQTWIDKTDACMDTTGRLLWNGSDFAKAKYPVTIMHRVGKKNAGHVLDGREWQEFPG